MDPYAGKGSQRGPIFGRRSYTFLNFRPGGSGPFCRKSRRDFVQSCVGTGAGTANKRLRGSILICPQLQLPPRLDRKAGRYGARCAGLPTVHVAVSAKHRVASRPSAQRKAIWFSVGGHARTMAGSAACVVPPGCCGFWGFEFRLLLVARPWVGAARCCVGRAPPSWLHTRGTMR